MKKITLFLSILPLGWLAFAQQDGSTLEQPVRPPVEMPWIQEDVGEFSDPIGYVHQRQADVMYSYTIWRRIDLRERMNHPLYFPKVPRGSWRSLAQVILDAVDVNNPDNPNALPVYANEFCTELTPREHLIENMSQTNQVMAFDPETLEPIGMSEVRNNFTSEDVYAYNLKEVWFFDKKRSLQEVRILEIEPVFEFEKPTNSDQYQNQNEEDIVELPRTQRRLGYIFYNELRPFLAKQEVYNVKNFSQRISLDDLLTWKRVFSGYIYAENNTYSDRYISDYLTNARDQMIESEKITAKIRVAEHDLWEF
jgi:gliding motility associated protien GldN